MDQNEFDKTSPTVGHIAIVIPAYNEAGAITKVITDLKDILRHRTFTAEVIVVDDCSQDDTVQRVVRTGSRVVRHVLNCGSGGATATGLSYAQLNEFDMAVTCDADGQHAPEDVIRGIDLMMAGRGGDLLIGSRLINSDGMTKTKIAGNLALSLFTALLFGVKVTDSQSGLRVFSKRALGSLKWRSSGYEFCSEMLWRARQQGLVVKEYPIQAIYTEYSNAKGQNNWNGINIIRTLIRRRVVDVLGE